MPKLIFLILRVESDETFHFSLIVGNGPTGTYGFLTSFGYEFNILDPNELLPASFYTVDTVTMGASFNHCLTIESCAPPHNIQSVTAGTGVANKTTNTCVSYTAPSSNFCGIDEFTVVVQNAQGIEKTVCIGVFVNDPPVAVNDAFTYVPNQSGQDLDVLNTGTADSDPASCDEISIQSAGTNGTGGQTQQGGTVTVNNNGTPNNPDDDFIDYTPPSGYSGPDQFEYIIIMLLILDIAIKISLT